MLGICTPHENILVEETENLASNVLPPGLLVVHDTGGGGEDDETELTRGKELDDPLLDVTELDVVTGRDDTGLVDLRTMLDDARSTMRSSGGTYAAVELDNNLAVAVVIDLLELANVAWKRRN